MVGTCKDMIKCNTLGSTHFSSVVVVEVNVLVIL